MGEVHGMVVEKSLLARIREKELEVSVKIDDARFEADRMIDKARKESLAIITSSEVEGKKAADEFLKREMERVHAEANQIRVQAREEVETVRKKGEKNLPKAVEKIIAIVLPG
ncbi:MAG TPA: V-type ATPase subunit subunit G family protein [Methanoregulaceae archaeon]|nr:MAG: hypothetical protein IPI71_00820 [Methanolinea sp.]HON80930.1 V-type ATPase subunit subunit G family protein [Methanoregulaceae archaeon]HRT15702.1 V-type ATPase subunit subunit G family protein [Methanoregulaceae archaeon]HRU31218.1 V-type ATPase subunit subunit G family protein [Methanoregulaceae archaeon]